MSYNISDSEKQQAEKALLYFNATEKALTISADHLNIMKTTLKYNTAVAKHDILKARAAIRRFRDKAINTLNGLTR